MTDNPATGGTAPSARPRLDVEWKPRDYNADAQIQGSKPLTVADHAAIRASSINPSQARSEDEVDRVLSILDELERRQR